MSEYEKGFMTGLFIGVIVMLLVFLNPLLCKAEPWTPEEISYQIADELLFFLDRCQTQEARLHDDLKEGNLILGSNPGLQEIDLYFAAVGIVHPLITAWLDRKGHILGWKCNPRLVWLKGTAIFQSVVVISNGFKLEWRFRF